MSDINVKPLSDRVIIKRTEETKTEGGIVIPETKGEKSQKGIVVAVGPGKMINGKLQKLALKCNDNVIFSKYSGTEITIHGVDYIVIKEDDVMLIIN